MKKERRKNRLGSNVESFWITHTERKRKKKPGLAGSLGYTTFACVYKSIYGGGGGE